MNEDDSREFLARIERIETALARIETFLSKEMRMQLSKKIMTEIANRDANVVEKMREIATREAAEYFFPYLVSGEMKVLTTKSDMFKRACDLAPRTGLVLEFGVAWARSINLIADHVQPRIVHGFDSFDGLPENWGVMAKKGDFAQKSLPAVRDNVQLHVGLFDATLPEFIKNHDEPIALLHLDADLYSSTAFVLESLAGRIRPGTMVLFDEYANYPGWRSGEFKAFQEFLERGAVAYRYDAINMSGRNMCQVLVEIVPRG